MDKSHVKKCFKTPPRPPKRLLDDPKRLGGLHNGCAFAAGAWCPSNPRAEHDAVQSLVKRAELFVAKQSRLASTGAASITAAAGSTPIASPPRSQGHVRGLRARQRVFLARPLGGRGSTSPATPSAPAACGDYGCGFAGAPSKTGRGHHHDYPPYIRRCRPPNKCNAGSRKYTSSTRVVAWFVLFLGYPSANVHNGRCLLSELKIAPSRRARCCRGSFFSTNVDRSVSLVFVYADDPNAAAIVCCVALRHLPPPLRLHMAITV